MQPQVDISVRRFFVDEFMFRQIPYVPAGSRILDLGGHRFPKRGKFDIESYDFNVLYANLQTHRHPDVQADALAVPFRDSTFDAVICSELLEHVPEPRGVLHEAARILRPGGKLLICVPFLYRIHADPYDYGRYTDYYWRQALAHAGFNNIQIEKQGLFFSVLADFFKQYAMNGYVRRPFGRVVLVMANIVHRMVLNLECSLSIRQNSFFNSFTTGFGVIAARDI